MTSVLAENSTLDFIKKPFICSCILAVERWISHGLELCVKLPCDNLRAYEINLKVLGAKPSVSLLITDVWVVTFNENRLKAFS